METLWCAEFDRMRALLANDGGEIKLQYAIAVGEVPVKMIESADVSMQDAEIRAIQRLRTRS